MKPIADTGLIVAVLAEACSFFPTPEPVLTLVARGDLILDFDLAAELPRILALVAKYADQPMDLADACVVRMSELAADSRVWTVDRTDFTAYRRNGRQSVPCDFPPRS